MNTDKINVENMKLLRQWSNHIQPNIQSTSNFERLCALGLVFIGMWLDQEIADKEKLRGRY